jgi:hypothetical protein
MIRRANTVSYIPTIFPIVLFLVLAGSPSYSEASSELKYGPKGPQQSASRGTALLVDTDEPCRLFVDDEDKGVITPAQSQRYKVNLGEHILKCTVESAPDLVWRKVVDVKDSSQVAAVIALKALHLQYEQAVAKAKNEKDGANAAAAQQMQEAEAAEKQREALEEQRQATKAAAPQQMFEMVKGDWHGVLVDTVLGATVQTTYEFRFDVVEDNGAIDGYETLSNKDEFKDTYATVPPDRLELVGSLCFLTKNKRIMKAGATKDKQGWADCMGKDGPMSPISRGAKTIYIRGNTLELHIAGFGFLPDMVVTLTR